MVGSLFGGWDVGGRGGGGVQWKQNLPLTGPMAEPSHLTGGGLLWPSANAPITEKRGRQEAILQEANKGAKCSYALPELNNGQSLPWFRPLVLRVILHILLSTYLNDGTL